MIICRFQVIQSSRDPSLRIFMLLEPYGVSSPPYSESKWNLHWWKAKPLLSFDEKIITDKSQHKKTQRLAINIFFHSKPTEEGVILNIQYMGLSTVVKLKTCILVGYFPFFDQKSYRMTVSENKF